MESTSVLRTLQSSYAEFMGLYPPGPYPPKEKNLFLNEGEYSSWNSGKGRPKLKIRESHDKEFLKKPNSLIDGFTLIPVYSYMTMTEYDDIGQWDCKYASDCFNYYMSTPSTFTKYGSYVVPAMRNQIG